MSTTAAVRLENDDGVHILLLVIMVNRFCLRDQPRVVAKSAGRLSCQKTRFRGRRGKD